MNESGAWVKTRGHKKVNNLSRVTERYCKNTKTDLVLEEFPSLEQNKLKLKGRQGVVIHR